SCLSFCHNTQTSHRVTEYYPTSYSYTLSLHDALPISISRSPCAISSRRVSVSVRRSRNARAAPRLRARSTSARLASSSAAVNRRSEEHTSELQSRSELVCRLLLEKKKKQKQNE